MPVNKRTRYEVLKRDNFTCRYCRSTEGELTVDHVVPVALGGADEPTNLVAACRDCNAGKASTTPDEATVAQADESAIRWAEAVKVAAQKMLSDRPPADTIRHSWFVEEWARWNEDLGYLPDGWAKSLDYWIAGGLPQVVILDCLSIAMGNRSVTHYNVFAYMGGIARKKLEVLQDEARQILNEQESGDGS